MKYLNSFNFSGKRALVRVDFNVPLDKEYKITDFTRIKAVIPTIAKILGDGGSVVLMSHLGRPKRNAGDGFEEKSSLKHLQKPLSDIFDVAVKFADDCIGEQAKSLANDLKAGEILLLENLRFYKEEEKGDVSFAEKLSKLGDIYVNDAFGTAHRAHSSTAVIAQFFADKVCGFVMQAELDNAKKVLENAEKPFTAIMGGAKVSDKIELIEKLLDKVDNLIVGGGMAYTFFKAQGGNIGNSLVEADKLDLALYLIKKAKEKGVNLMLPQDSIIADAFSNDANTEFADNENIKDGFMGLDIGEKAIKSFVEVIKNSKTILWNGPMGVFEMEKFQHGTKAIAEAIADATKHGAFSLIGGGDSVAAINKFNLVDKVSFVSTGGGALLEYFEGKILPGIAAVKEL